MGSVSVDIVGYELGRPARSGGRGTRLLMDAAWGAGGCRRVLWEIPASESRALVLARAPTQPRLSRTVRSDFSNITNACPHVESFHSRSDPRPARNEGANGADVRVRKAAGHADPRRRCRTRGCPVCPADRRGCGPVAWQECEAGADVFNRGLPSGVPAETIESIRETRVVLKGPLEKPGTGRGPTKIPPGSTLALTNRRSTT